MTFQMIAFHRRAAFVLVVAAGAAACSNGGKGGAQPGNGDGAAGASGDGGASSGDGRDAPNFFPRAGNGGGGSGAGGAGAMLPPGCTQHTIAGERLPIDLYMMIDSSESMLQKTADGQSKWAAIRSALSSFFAKPESAGIGVGLQFFPQIAPGSQRTCKSDAACGAYGPCFGIRTCSGLPYIEQCATAADCQSGASCIPFGYCATTNDFCTPVGSPCASGRDTCAGDVVEGYCLGRESCMAADYAKPAVAVAPLPAATSALESALAARMPDGYTPTSAALSGALDQVRALAKSNPLRRAAVVLATDGLPTSCQPKDIGAVAAIAQRAFAETPSLPTFVIGVFAPQEQGAMSNLNQIAQSGGTAPARIVDTSGNVASSFLAALDDIRATAVGCEIKVPASTTGGQIDFGNVNVRFTSGRGQETTIPNAPDRSKCQAGQAGWYYDVDPAQGTPTKILFCDSTCGLVKSDPKGRIDVLIGCKTIVIE